MNAISGKNSTISGIPGKPQNELPCCREHPEQTWQEAVAAMQGENPLPPHPEPPLDISSWLRPIGRCSRKYAETIVAQLALTQACPKFSCKIGLLKVKLGGLWQKVFFG